MPRPIPADEGTGRRKQPPLHHAYGLQDELSPKVPDEQITLYRPDRAEDVKRLLSYIIGCAMGRYGKPRQTGGSRFPRRHVGFDPTR